MSLLEQLCEAELEMGRLHIALQEQPFERCGQVCLRPHMAPEISTVKANYVLEEIFSCLYVNFRNSSYMQNSKSYYEKFLKFVRLVFIQK